MASLFGFDEQRLFAETWFRSNGRSNPSIGCKAIAHAEREEVLATAEDFASMPRCFERGLGEALELNGESAELVERMILEGVGSHFAPCEGRFREGVRVDDENAR